MGAPNGLAIADCRLPIYGMSIGDCRLTLAIADFIDDWRLTIGIDD
jgi:hypothetical protein